VTGASRFQRAVKRRSIGVSIRASLHALGRVMEIGSLALVLPALVAAGYFETPLPFLVPLAIGLALGFLLERTNRGKGRLSSCSPGWQRRCSAASRTCSPHAV
jgi:hypothetical protein